MRGRIFVLVLASEVLVSCGPVASDITAGNVSTTVIARICNRVHDCCVGGG